MMVFPHLGYPEHSGDAVAVTAIYYVVADGAITDTDIIFNPKYTFSTTFADDTMDLQSVVTHELDTPSVPTTPTCLAPPYPVRPATDKSGLAEFGRYCVRQFSVSGNWRKRIRHGRGRALDGGQPLAVVWVTALNPSNGVTVSGFTSLADGPFRFQALVGDTSSMWSRSVDTCGPATSISRRALRSIPISSRPIWEATEPDPAHTNPGPRSPDLQASAGSAAFRPVVGYRASERF